MLEEIGENVYARETPMKDGREIYGSKVLLAFNKSTLSMRAMLATFDATERKQVVQSTTPSAVPINRRLKLLGEQVESLERKRKRCAHAHTMCLSFMLIA